MTLVSLLALGFFLGMRHAADPDHVLAVSTIVARQRTIRSAGLIGCVWGIGHTLTLLVVGGAILVFGLVIPHRVGLTMELAVALMLVVLGLLNLTRVASWIRDTVATLGPLGVGRHSHTHSHGDYGHSHPHGHGRDDHGHREDQTPQAWLDRRLGRVWLYRALRPLVVGVVHGLAGSAALALLVLTTVPHPAWGVAYLLVFGLGTIAGMMLITVAVAVPFAYAPARINGYLRVASGVLSLAFGLFLVYQIGFVDGLFVTDSPEVVR